MYPPAVRRPSDRRFSHVRRQPGPPRPSMPSNGPSQAEDHRPPTIAVVRVRFADGDDAGWFVEWLQARSRAARSPITMGMFVQTAADTCAISSALLGFGQEVVDSATIPASITPGSYGLVESTGGVDVVFAAPEPPASMSA